MCCPKSLIVKPRLPNGGVEKGNERVLYTLVYAVVQSLHFTRHTELVSMVCTTSRALDAMRAHGVGAIALHVRSADWRKRAGARTIRTGVPIVCDLSRLPHSLFTRCRGHSQRFECSMANPHVPASGYGEHGRPVGVACSRSGHRRTLAGAHSVGRVYAYG